MASPITGAAGNVEFLVHGARTEPTDRPSAPLGDLVEAAVREVVG
jgi:hypothetical protein